MKWLPSKRHVDPIPVMLLHFHGLLVLKYIFSIRSILSLGYHQHIQWQMGYLHDANPGTLWLKIKCTYKMNDKLQSEIIKIYILCVTGILNNFFAT